MRHHVFRTFGGKLLLLLALLTAVLGGQAAAAQEPGPSCIDDVTESDVVCSASDVGLSELSNAAGEITCTPGDPLTDPVTLNLRACLVSTSKDRYDVGIFVALDGGDARTGWCYHGYLPPPLAAAGLYDPGSSEAGGGPFYNAEPDDTLDQCGDLEQGVPNYYDLEPITVPCLDSDGDGYLNISTAVSWDGKKTNTCLDASGAIPNTPAKCRFATINVGNVYVEPGEIQVAKTADPTELSEPGGMVAFTFAVQNNSAVTVTLQTLVDSVYGSLPDWEDGDCIVPQTLGPGGLYECSISAEVEGELGIHRDTVTAEGIDWYQKVVSDTATAEVMLAGLFPEISVIKVADPTIIKEPGGEILYSVTVTSSSGTSDPVTLTSLVDDLYGDLTDPANSLISGSTCQTGTVLDPGEDYTCTFTAQVSGASGKEIVDTVTATAIDDDGAEAVASDDAKVTIAAVPPHTGVGLPAMVVACGVAAVGLALLLTGALSRRAAG